MLAKGKVSGCSRNDIDVALGKHHDRYEVQGIAPGGEMNKAKPPPTGGEASPAESDEPEPSPAFELVKSGGLKPEALKQFRQRMRDAGDGKPPTTTTTKRLSKIKHVNTNSSTHYTSNGAEHHVPKHKETRVQHHQLISRRKT